jgi:hypothetical protein
VKLHIGTSVEPMLYNGCPFLVTLGCKVHRSKLFIVPLEPLSS